MATTKLPTRERLLTAGVDVLRESGPAAFTVRTVATRAGTSIGQIRYYFGSMDGFLIECSVILSVEWGDAVEQVAASAKVRSLRALAEAIAEVLIGGASDNAIIARYQLLLSAGRLPEAAAAFSELHAVRASAVGELVARGRAASVLTAEGLERLADGAAVDAISTGRDVQASVTAVVRETLRRV